MQALAVQARQFAEQGWLVHSVPPVSSAPWRGSIQARDRGRWNVKVPTTSSTVPPSCRRGREPLMIIIGIDPHKHTYTAVAVDQREQPVGQRTVLAGPSHRRAAGLGWPLARAPLGGRERPQAGLPPRPAARPGR
jgi:hypothetical protein